MQETKSKEYKYVLKLIDGEDVITSEFSAFITAEDITYRLRDFLLGAGWDIDNVKEILVLE